MVWRVSRRRKSPCDSNCGAVAANHVRSRSQQAFSPCTLPLSPPVLPCVAARLPHAVGRRKRVKAISTPGSLAGRQSLCQPWQPQIEAAVSVGLTQVRQLIE
jgi:hypothetical protein